MLRSVGTWSEEKGGRPRGGALRGEVESYGAIYSAGRGYALAPVSRGCLDACVRVGVCASLAGRRYDVEGERRGSRGRESLWGRDVLFGWEGVEGACDLPAALFEDVDVFHGGAQVRVAQQLLDGAHVGAVLKEVGGE